MLGTYRQWHSHPEMPLFGIYKPAAVTRTCSTDFICSNFKYDPIGLQKTPEPKEPSDVLKIVKSDYTQKGMAKLVLWLNISFPGSIGDMFLLHKTGVGVDETEHTKEYLCAMTNLEQPLWALNGYREDIGWVG